MGTFINFPNIPQYPGVPQLMRPVSTAIAENTPLSIGLGTVENLLISALQQTPKWGIFDQFGNQLGINSNSSGILSAIGGTLLSQLTGSIPAQLSTFSVEFSRETRVASFPLEQGSFASYDKAQMPANPVVTLMLQGSVNDRTTLLEALDSACISTDLYNVVTPEIIYTGYSVERYSYARKADRGVTLLVVEVSLKEIRQVTASYTTAPSPIANPQNPAAAAQQTNGLQQPAAPPQSTALQLFNSVKHAWTSNLAPMFLGGGS
jgi:hypothetical protein